MKYKDARAKVRLNALVHAGWSEKQAKKYIKKHDSPQHMVEVAALFWWRCKLWWKSWK